MPARQVRESLRGTSPLGVKGTMNSSLYTKQYRINREGTNILVAADRDIKLNLLKDGNIEVSESDRDARVQIQIINARKRTNLQKPAKSCLKYYVDVHRPFNGTDSDFNHLDAMFAVDTNYRIVDDATNIKMCVGVSGKIQLKKHKEYPDGGLFVHGSSFAFFTRHQNPELISLHWIICDIVESRKNLPLEQIGIVLDSDFEKQDAFNNREIPYVGQHYLPPGFTLIYAAADSCAGHLANKMIRICDRGCKKAFRSLTNEDVECKQRLGDKPFHIHKRLLWD
jgi:hypothetical protein